MKQSKVISGRIEGHATYHFDDYPPGTSLPAMPQPDLSHMHPLLRAWVQRRMKKVQRDRQVRIEAERDEYYRQKETGADGASS